VTFSFWVHEPPPSDVFAKWDPDRDPTRFASAVGHNILELAKRVEALGAPVRVAEDRVAPESLLVFFLRDAYSSPPALRRVMRAIHQARGRFVVIRSDTPSDWAFPLRPVREFVPTRGSIRESWQRWVPPLTQRGLRARTSSRRGNIRTLALKGNKSNVPPIVRTREWVDALASRGIGWWLDMSERADDLDQAWHDFAEVDAILCAHHPDHLHDPFRKPATKLLNAWAAGCVPLAERMPAYLELGTEGQDVLFLDQLTECVEVLAQLNSDPGRLASIERNVAERGREFSVERTSRRWLDALLEAAEAADETAWRRSTRMIAIAEKRLVHLAHEAVAAARRPGADE
jgi:hypothetical protein